MQTARLLATLLLAAGLGAAQPPAHAAEGAKDFSAAERLLFMSNQLRSVQPPATLRYSFRKSGTLEPGFDDKVTLALKAVAGQPCCAAHVEFLGAERSAPMPDQPAAEGNPVLLAFLEREVREMQRLTKGSQNHFRKRLRMAIYEAATVRDLPLRYRGQTVAGKEVAISPYLDDPNRPRYDKLARKEYRFLLSDAVPGGLFAIRTQIPGADGSAPLLAEELLLDGAEPGTGTAK